MQTQYWTLWYTGNLPVTLLQEMAVQKKNDTYYVQVMLKKKEIMGVFDMSENIF